MDQNERLISILEKIEARLDTLDITMVKNTISLEEHIKRTNLLEEDFKPIKKHVELINTASKIISGVVGAAIVAKQLGIF